MNRMRKPSGVRTIDFASPKGEATLLAADSVQWRVFKNPVAMAVRAIRRCHSAPPTPSR